MMQHVHQTCKHKEHRRRRANITHTDPPRLGKNGLMTPPPGRPWPSNFDSSIDVEAKQSCLEKMILDLVKMLILRCWKFGLSNICFLFSQPTSKVRILHIFAYIYSCCATPARYLAYLSRLRQTFRNSFEKIHFSLDVGKHRQLTPKVIQKHY